MSESGRYHGADVLGVSRIIICVASQAYFVRISFQKEECQLSKLQKVLRPDEFAAATANITNRDQRLQVLENQYKELEEHYLAILERIAAN